MARTDSVTRNSSCRLHYTQCDPALLLKNESLLVLLATHTLCYYVLAVISFLVCFVVAVLGLNVAGGGLIVVLYVQLVCSPCLGPSQTSHHHRRG